VERDTVEVYERQASEWKARRRPRFRDRARAFAEVVRPGQIRADIGCGPGTYALDLGEPLVALDAARAMLELTRERAPAALLVQADLEALPLRDRSLGGAFARASYLHVPRARLPLALAHLHRATRVGAPIALIMKRGDYEGDQLPDDDFPGRFFASWEPDALVDVVAGAGFVVELVAASVEWIEVSASRARTLPDTVGTGMRLLVCGLNPSLYAADAGVGFARPGNRFWPAALTARLVSRDRDPYHALTAHGVGMTDLVKRATRRADEVRVEEYGEGAARVARLMEWFHPAAVCFVGLAGYRAAIDHRGAAGEQPEPFGGVPAYVMPSTSGLNAHVRLDDVVEHLRAAAALADRRPG
jgi:double-stranded uracil-DNA glycosylase